MKVQKISFVGVSRMKQRESNNNSNNITEEREKKKITAKVTNYVGDEKNAKVEKK